LAVPLTAGAELTLAEAERLALEQAPWFAHHRSNVEAAAERAVYESRLPDPQLVLGAINVPTDTYRLNQEDMTMTMVGVRQTFPPGDTLALKGQRAQKELTREQAKLEAERRNLLKQVRQVWLEIHYQEESLRLLQATQRLLQKQLDAAEGRYRAAGDMQQSVLRARQALARVNEREPMVKGQIAKARAVLGRWIGVAAAQALPASRPGLPVPAPGFDPVQHPESLASEAMQNAARLEVDMAREEYKPGWMLDLSYGFRRAMPDGTERPNMVTAMVTVDLPVFRSKRQDRRLAEKQALESGARHEAEDKRRELEAMHAAARAEYEALTARAKVFDEQLLPALRRETQVTVAGFARDQTEYRDAQMKTLEAEQEYARLHADLAKTQAELLYLTGEQL
jgi:outer membrane protein TolC